jgi:hypothetical protein
MIAGIFVTPRQRNCLELLHKCLLGAGTNKDHNAWDEGLQVIKGGADNKPCRNTRRASRLG